MNKKFVIILLTFIVIAIPVTMKLHDSYMMYVDGQDQFLSEAIARREAVLAGDLELTQDQLLHMYVLEAKAEPSRFAMRYSFYFNVAFFLLSLTMLLVGWYTGYREGKKENA